MSFLACSCLTGLASDDGGTPNIVNLYLAIVLLFVIAFSAIL